MKIGYGGKQENLSHSQVLTKPKPKPTALPKLSYQLVEWPLRSKDCHYLLSVLLVILYRAKIKPGSNEVFCKHTEDDLEKTLCLQKKKSVL